MMSSPKDKVQDLEFSIRLGATLPWPQPGQEGYSPIINEDGQLVYDNTLRLDVDSKVEWKNVWATGTYDKNDMVRDGRYAMVANKETPDRPAPQNVGLPYYVYDGTMGTVSDTASQIIFGNRYIILVAGKLVGFRLYVTTGNHYQVFLVETPTTVPVFSELLNFTSGTTGWVDIDYSEIIVAGNQVFDLVAVTNEPAGTPTVTTLNYDYDTPNNSGTPGVGQIEHSNAEPSQLLVRKTDDDGNDNSTFLEGLKVGDIIELNTIRWSIQDVQDSGNYMTYQVSPATQYGSDGVYGFNFETVVPTPISMGVDIDYNLTTSQEGLFIIDGRYEDIVPDDNQYGVDVEIQEISISPDWDVVAIS